MGLDRRAVRRATLRAVVAGGIAAVVGRAVGRGRPAGGSVAVAVAAAGAVASEAPLLGPIAAVGARCRARHVAGAAGAELGREVLVGVASWAASVAVWPLVDHSPADAAPIALHDLDAGSRRGPSPTGEGLVLVANASSGSANDEALDALLADELPDAELVRFEGDDDLAEVMRDAAARAVTLGAMGGDGTLNAAAGAALEAGVPLLVFAGGTLNHFARDLGLDDWSDSVAALRSGRLVGVDVATIAGRSFLNTASFGSYPELVDARERFEERVGKWPALAVALVTTLRHHEPIRARVNGRTRTLWMVFVGNCAYDPPGFAPATRQRLDDGLLDVRIVNGDHPFSRTRLVAAVLTGRLARSRVYRRELVDSIDVAIDTGDAGGSRLACDGEVFDGPTRFRIAKAPGRLAVHVPA